MSISREQPHNFFLTTRELLPTALVGWSLALLAGFAASLYGFKGGLEELAAAQLTMGATGLVAGSTYARLVRKAGATPTVNQTLLFAIIQAVVLIVGVTPLFAAVGFTLKLSLLAFYSFSTTGALGGLAFYFVLKSVFPDRVPGYPATLLSIGYFSMGLAAATGSAFDLLKQILPGPILVSLSVLAIVAIAATGTAATAAYFLAGRSNLTTNASGSTVEYGGDRKTRRGYLTIALIVILVPFYVNDLANIYISHWGHWLTIDYLFVKVYPLLIIAYLLKTQRINPDNLGLNAQKATAFLGVFLMGTLSVLFVLYNDGLVTRLVGGYPRLGGIPAITNPFWHQFDFYGGLLLVAIVEELVFRGLFYIVLKKYTQNSVWIVLMSAIAFGLIHWSAGFAVVTASFAAGAIYMALYVRTRSLPAIILSHYVVDLISFSGLIPPDMLVFM